MTTDLSLLVNKAATGDPGAFADLLAALHQDVRAWMAVFATNKAMVDTAEREVWAHLRKELLAGVPDFPITNLVLQISASVLSRMLQSVQNSSQNGNDALQTVVTTDGLKRLENSNSLSHDIIQVISQRYQDLPENDRALLEAIHRGNKSLHDIAELQKIPLTKLATLYFKIRQRVISEAVQGSDGIEDNKLALLIGCHLDGSIIPTDQQELQQRIRSNPSDAEAVAQQIRTFVILNELIDPQAHTTVRLFASELMQNSQPRTRTDSSMIRAVDRASVKSRRIIFEGLPPPPQPVKPTALWPVFLIAGALVVVGFMTLSMVWNPPTYVEATTALAPSSLLPTPGQKSAVPPPSTSGSIPLRINQTTPSSAHEPRFLRGINLGGRELIINNRPFLGTHEAKQNGFSIAVGSQEKTAQTITAPGLDFDTKSLLECGLANTDGQIVITQTAPPGTYLWWLWISNPQGLNITQTTVKTASNVAPLHSTSLTNSSPVYGRFGPFSCDAVDGKIALTISSLGNNLLCAVEIRAAPDTTMSLPIRFNVRWPDKEITAGEGLLIPAQVGGEGSENLSMVMSINGQKNQQINKPPYVFQTGALKAGNYDIQFTVYDGDEVLFQGKPKRYQVMESGVKNTVLFERWDDKNGLELEIFNRLDLFNKSASSAQNVPGIFCTKEQGTRYAARWRGYITPTVSGPHVFLLTCNGDSVVFLSPNMENKDLKKIVANKRINKADKETEPLAASNPINLQQGEVYYIEVLYKAGPKDNFLKLGWQLPNGKKQLPIPSTVFSPANPYVPAYLHIFID